MKKLTLLSTSILLYTLSTAAMAQEAVSPYTTTDAGSVCLGYSDSIAMAVGGAVMSIHTICSVLANFVKPDSVLGKIVHYGAANIKVQKPVA